MIRAFLRYLGFHVHKGWKSIDRHGTEIKCIGCGEQRTKYMLWVTPPAPDWWETSKTGDGSCGNIPELPCRWEFF